MSGPWTRSRQDWALYLRTPFERSVGFVDVVVGVSVSSGSCRSCERRASLSDPGLVLGQSLESPLSYNALHILRSHCGNLVRVDTSVVLRQLNQLQCCAAPDLLVLGA